MFRDICGLVISRFLSFTRYMAHTEVFRFKSNEMALHPSNFVAMGFSNTGHSTLETRSVRCY